MILFREVNLANLAEEDHRYQLKGLMGELPDQEIYGLFLAKYPAVTQGVGVGQMYLTAMTKVALGTQRGPSNSVRARYELLRVDAGPAAAAVLSPGSLQPPAYMKMTNPMRPDMKYDMKSMVGMTFYAKSAKGTECMKSAMGMVYEFATFTVEGKYKTPYKKPAKEQWRGTKRTGRRSFSNKAPSILQGVQIVPLREDIVGVLVVCTFYVVRNLAHGDG